MQEYTLNTGRKVPTIGFGTWRLAPDEVAQEAVETALRLGYRVIDTAKLYANERGVGQAVRGSRVPRAEIFLTTKVWQDDLGYEPTLAAFDASLQRLGLDFVDLYLIHWPATEARHDSWRALEKLLQDAKIKAAGVSNYGVKELKQVLSQSDVVPAVNQIEFHPFNFDEQRPVLEFCQQHDILVEAYSPIKYLDGQQPVVNDIADRLERTPQQVVLRWCIQHGTLPLPRSSSETHMRSNLQVFDFELTNDDMKRLDSLS